MKTIAEIATEIQVSKQAINKRIKQEPLKSDIQSSISFVGNKMYIDTYGQQCIKSVFYKKSATTENKVADIAEQVVEVVDKATTNSNQSATKNITTDNEVVEIVDKTATNSNISATTTTGNNIIDNEIIKLLQQNISILQQQLEIKDKQIENKDKQIEEKDKQIDKLTSAVKLHAESVSADSQNQLAETIIEGKEKLIEGTKRSGGFLRKLFKGKEK